MQILDGKKEAEKILSDLKKRIAKEKLSPKLAVILVGRNRASELYVKLKTKAAEKIGGKLVLYKFGKSVAEGKIIRQIKDLNNDSSIHGIIVQLPLPKKFRTDRIIGAVSPQKDVDGFQRNSRFSPVLPLAIFLALKKGVKTFKNKKAVALVNSDVFGRTLQKFLKKNKITVSYILKSEVSRQKFEERTKSADILISVCGIPYFIKSEMIKKGAVLIDVGISYAGRSRKVLGDIDRESVKDKASFLTPVPGGIGPLTVASLLKNLFYAVKNKHD